MRAPGPGFRLGFLVTPWEPRITPRFDPSKPLARVALAVAIECVRYVQRDEPVPPALEELWLATASAAAWDGRVRSRVYTSFSRGVGETERLAVVVEGCMRLAAAYLSWERSGSVTT